MARDTAGGGDAAGVTLTYGVADYSSWTVSEDGHRVRPMTREDVIAGTKLIEVLGPRGMRSGVPGVPQDVPPELLPIEQFMIGARYARSGGTTPLVSDIATAGIIRDMNRVYGRAMGAAVWLPNPLVFGGPNVDILWHFRTEVTSAMVGSMPVMGISGPCDPIAVMTFALAETLGGAAIIHALLPAVPVSIFPHPEPGDMRTGALTVGTPEWDLLDLMHRDVLASYGTRWNTKLLHTSASLPGPQAQAERAMSALSGVLGGYDSFTGLGGLGVDEVWSPAQMILDLDIIGHAARIGRGAVSAPDLALDRLPAVVEEAVAAELLFAENETTVRNMRAQYFMPRVLQRLDRSQWVTVHMPDVAHAAADQARALVATYDYEPPQETLAELTVIYERARNELCRR